MKKLLRTVVVLAVAFFAASGYALEFKRAENFEDAFSASCRVSVSGARGSGTFVYYDESNAYILTNYHVVTTNDTATVEFWTNSKLQRLPGRVIWRYYDVKSSKPKDFAFIVVDAQRLKSEVDPPFMPMAGPNVRPAQKSYICSAGAPDGRFVQAWKGEIVGYYNGETVEFQPPPVPGQSGSGIISFYDNQPWLTAVLTWLFGEKGQDSSTGGAIPIANLYDAVKNRPLPTSYHDEGNETPSIPDNASECGGPSYRALIFSGKDCPACEKAKPELTKVVKVIETAVVDTGKPNGYNLAKSYSVSTIPTIVIVDDKDNAIAVISSKEIEAGEAVKKIEELRAHSEMELSQKKTEPEVAPVESEIPPLPDDLGKEDFREREPVREHLYDVGLIDWSEKNWFNSRGGKEEPSCPPKDDPEQPKIDGRNNNDDDNSSRLLARLTNNIVSKVGDQIKSSIAESLGTASDKIEEKIEERVKEKYAEVEPIVQKKVRSLAFKGCVLFVALTIFSLLIFGTVKRGLAWCKKIAIAWLVTLKIPEENTQNN